MSLGCGEWVLCLGRGIQKGMFSMLSEVMLPTY